MCCFAVGYNSDYNFVNEQILIVDIRMEFVGVCNWVKQYLIFLLNYHRWVKLKCWTRPSLILWQMSIPYRESISVAATLFGILRFAAVFMKEIFIRKSIFSHKLIFQKWIFGLIVLHSTEKWRNQLYAGNCEANNDASLPVVMLKHIASDHTNVNI